MKTNTTFQIFFTIAVLLISLSYGCNERSEGDLKSSLLVSTFNEDDWKGKIFYKNNTEYQLLFLNENDNVIGDITNIKLFDNHILIYERERDVLFLYSINGDFISKIGNKGNGPGEYTRITYYDLFTKDGESVIEILDANRWELQVYKLSGEQKEVKKLKTDLNYFSFIHTDYGYFFYTPDNEEKHMLVLFSNDLKKIVKKYLYDDSNFVPNEDLHFVRNPNNVLFHYGYNDTIYSIDGEQVKPYINIDFGERKISNSDAPKAKTIKEFQNILYFSNNTYLGNINNMMSNGNKLIFQFRDIKMNEFVQNYYGEIDLNKRESFFYKAIASDYPFSFSIIGIQKDFYLGIIYPYKLSESSNSYFKENHNKNVSTMSNPILIKIYE